MKFAALSFHINDIGVEGLSRLSVKPEQQIEHLSQVVRDCGALDGFYLATCNRVEYVLRFSGSLPESFPIATDLVPRAFLSIETVIEHLLSVALSKDSVVFGENQIMGQFKDSFNRLKEAGALSTQSERLLSLVLREAKSIRTDMGLSNVHTSVASVAARQIFANYRDDKHAPILLVGAGESNQIMGRYLAKRDFSNMIWVNRTDARSEVMAREIGGRTILWADFMAGKIPKATIISLATNSPDVLLSVEALEASSPKLVVDISVPANASKVDVLAAGADYLGMDEISHLMHHERARYEEVISEMTDYIKESTALILGEMTVHQSNSILKDTILQTQNVFESVFEQDLPNELKALDPHQQVALRNWSEKLMRKIMHTHLETLKVVLKNPRD